jgi:hypothetical protein
LEHRERRGNIETYGQAVKNLITLLLWSLLEYLEILEDLRVDLYFVIEANTILSQEVKNDFIRGFQGDVFEFQGTAAGGISLIFALLVTRSKCKLINEIDSSGLLSICHELVLEVLLIIPADPIDVFLNKLVSI